MLLDINLFIMIFITIKESFLVEFLSLDCIALIFNLTCKFSADILLFFRRDLLAKFKSSEPVLEIHPHFKGKLWL
jgi:hypothetical protein